ncbi:MAG: lectin-like domain-containing protein, partial [Dolichospermum sp.]
NTFCCLLEYNTNLFPLDLTTNFELNFQLNFGIKDSDGADGMTFLLTKSCNPILLGGGSLGVEGIQNSLLVEFDTYDNGVWSGLNDSTPEDHIIINKNGDLSSVGVVSDWALPVCANAFCLNIESNQFLNVKIQWYYIAPTLQIMYVYFDNVLRATSSRNHISDSFNGQTKVFWSITGSTGGSSNLQQFKNLNPNNLVLNGVNCNSTYSLTAPTLGTNYQWTNNASTTNVASYVATSSTTQTCNYVDSCGIPRSVTFTINVPSAITPTFTQIPACFVPTLLTLPTTSDNGITGTWSPALNNTATTTYTFTPTPGQCATTATMTIGSGNILVNPSFELPIQPNFGNNVLNWPINGWNGVGSLPNIVKTNGGPSTGGPNNASDGIHYLDIKAGAADFYQEFIFHCNYVVYFSGYFSVRGNTPSTGRIDLLRVNADNTTTLISSSNQLNMPSTPNIWYLASGSAVITPGLYRFHVTLGDNSNFDNACFSFDGPDVSTNTYGPLCENSGSITLTGTPTDSFGTWSGNGIANNGDGTAIFNPSGLGGTIVPVTYSYFNALGIGCAKTTDITVTPNVTPTFTQVAAICSGATLSAL